MSERYKDAYRGYLIDHHSPAPPIVTLERLEASEYERFYQKACIDTLMVYCKDHWGYSYYDTKIGYKHPALEGDGVGTTASILKEKGIEFNAYYCIEYDVTAPKEQPQWSVRHADGRPRTLGGRNAKWGIPCYLTGYREYALRQLEEIVENYHPDSLFLDIFGKTLCYCPSCRESFRERYGYELPESEEGLKEHTAQVIRFLDDCAGEFLDELLERVKRIDESLAVTINFSSHYPQRIREKLDYHFTEPWAGNWHSAAFARETGVYPQLGPGDVSFVYDYLPENVYRLAAAQIASQGCRVFLYSEPQRPDGSLEEEEAKRLGSAMADVKSYERVLKRERRAYAEVGILQSDSSVEVGYTEGVKANAIERARTFNIHVNAIRGAMKVADHCKVPWKIVPEGELEEALKSLEVLLLPEVLVVGPRTLELLERFVEAGGVIVATGESGLYDSEGKRGSDSVLSPLAGIRHQGRERRYATNVWGGFLDLVDKESWALPSTSFPITPESPIIEAQESRVEGTYTYPATVLSQESWVNWGYPPPKEGSSRALVTCREQGKGLIWYISFDLFSLSEAKMNWPKEFVRELLARSGYAPKLYVKTEAPFAVQTVAYRSEGNLVVHVLSQLASLTGGDRIAIRPGVLKVSKELKEGEPEVSVYGREGTLEVADGGPYWEIGLPEVEEHMIVEVR